MLHPDTMCVPQLVVVWLYHSLDVMLCELGVLQLSRVLPQELHWGLGEMLMILRVWWRRCCERGWLLAWLCPVLCAQQSLHPG
jgi:hypothetical protein